MHGNSTLWKKRSLLKCEFDNEIIRFDLFVQCQSISRHFYVRVQLCFVDFGDNTFRLPTRQLPKHITQIIRHDNKSERIIKQSTTLTGGYRRDNILRHFHQLPYCTACQLVKI